MPIRRKIPFREGNYFITFTCFQWMPLIRLIQGYDLVYQWFDKLYLLGHYVCGYVIMPNHIHLMIWQPSFDWKECDSEYILIQKLDYMRANPCTGKWNLTDSPVDYIHSSAGFYLGMEHQEYRITHYQELDDIDLTK